MSMASREKPADTRRPVPRLYLVTPQDPAGLARRTERRVQPLLGGRGVERARLAHRQRRRLHDAVHGFDPVAVGHGHDDPVPAARPVDVLDPGRSRQRREHLQVVARVDPERDAEEGIRRPAARHVEIRRGRRAPHEQRLGRPRGPDQPEVGEERLHPVEVGHLVRHIGDIGGAGGGRGGGGRRSDVALKHDIALLGWLDNGLGFYRFSYNGSRTPYVGVIAQEVQAVMPQAIVRGRDGYLRVFYDKLGVKFETYDAWIASGGRLPRAGRHPAMPRHATGFGST